MLLFFRFILLPISLLYAIVIILRNKLYDWKIFRTTSFDIPVISVGNITVGGTGKTPHIAYLIKKLKNNYKTAVLSRGYGRLTKGFKLVTENSLAVKVGDEPLMLKQKFKDVIIAVDESRVEGIQKLKDTYPNLQLILLDDAFQHRAVKAGLHIVLIDYHQPVFNDCLLPAGRLRENQNALSRADIIVLTKTPGDLNKIQQSWWNEKLNLLPHQKLYFSSVEYGELIALKDTLPKLSFAELKNYDCLLVSGIAQHKTLVAFLESKCKSVLHLHYSDHYNYTEEDVRKIRKKFNDIKGQHKILITTEKDACRLKGLIDDSIPLYVLPIEVNFQFQKKDFDEAIQHFIDSFTYSN